MQVTGYQHREVNAIERRFLLLIFFKRRGQSMPYRVSIRVVRRRKTGARGKSVPESLLGFPRERQGRTG